MQWLPNPDLEPEAALRELLSGPWQASAPPPLSLLTLLAQAASHQAVLWVCVEDVLRPK